MRSDIDAAKTITAPAIDPHDVLSDREIQAIEAATMLSNRIGIIPTRDAILAVAYPRPITTDQQSLAV